MSAPSHQPSAKPAARVLPFQTRGEAQPGVVSSLAILLAAERTMSFADICAALDREGPRHPDEVR